jgi:hypothetical protein
LSSLMFEKSNALLLGRLSAKAMLRFLIWFSRQTGNSHD